MTVTVTVRSVGHKYPLWCGRMNTLAHNRTDGPEGTKRIKSLGQDVGKVTKMFDDL